MERARSGCVEFHGDWNWNQKLLQQYLVTMNCWTCIRNHVKILWPVRILPYYYIRDLTNENCLRFHVRHLEKTTLSCILNECLRLFMRSLWKQGHQMCGTGIYRAIVTIFQIAYWSWLNEVVKLPCWFKIERKRLWSKQMEIKWISW